MPATTSRNFKWWLRVTIHAALVLCGQSAATLLGRLYFDKGGKSIWMAALVQLAAFPILLPYYCISPLKTSTKTNTHMESPSTLTLTLVYLSLGILVAAESLLYSIGLMYLPVSTYSLISASQLAFNALFSFFLNSQKFTPFIINSLVLLTISSTLLVFQNNSDNSLTGVSEEKYAAGFICTIAASAGHGLVLSLTQLSFKMVLKDETFSVVMDMIIYESLVATCAILVGLFAGGEWQGLKKEMDRFESGKTLYVVILTSTAIAWQVYTIGAVGLIFEASSLFSNAVSVLGLPIVPILAVVLFADKMDGVKVIAMVLAVWGFISYVYQHYLTDSKSKMESRNVNETSIASLP